VNCQEPVEVLSSSVVIVSKQDNGEPEEGSLLKQQFTDLNGLVSTLYQDKKLQITESSVQNKLQIIYCKKRHYWIVATTINCRLGEVRVYDSFFQYCNKEIEHTIADLFQLKSEKPKITVAQSQKQKGGTDCGVFATAVAFRINMSKLQLKQESMRTHLINSFNKQYLSPFPHL